MKNLLVFTRDISSTLSTIFDRLLAVIDFAEAALSGMQHY